jgi:hypothetical protein
MEFAMCLLYGVCMTADEWWRERKGLPSRAGTALIAWFLVVLIWKLV